MPAGTHKTSVFSHLGSAVAAAVSVLAMVTFAALAACFSSSAGITVEEGGTNSAGTNSGVAVEAITGSAAEEEAVGAAAGVEGGTGDAGAAAFAAASRFAARTLLRCLSLGPR